jgi:hypothetical protein
MVMSIESPKKWDKNSAIVEMNAILQRIMPTGVTDEEYSAVNMIIEAVRTDQITPEEGVKKVYELEERRQQH